MRRTLLVAAMVPAAAAAFAQSPDVARATDVPDVSSFELRAGAMFLTGERNYAFAGTVNSAGGSLQGAELLVRRGLGGVSVRTFDGRFGSQSEVASADVTALVGPPAFTVQAGYARRAVVGQLATQLYSFARVGAQGSFRIGGSGLRAMVGGWDYVPMGDSGTRIKLGFEGETLLIYALSAEPVYLLAGYRTELFTPRTFSATADDAIPEEVHGIRLGVGLQIGGR